jgi:KDO2-lipid IV(A) lauroyltransferase
MSEGDVKPGKYIRPKDLDNAQRTTLSARIQWRLESLAWDILYWYPMKAMPLSWASNAGAAILKALGPLTSQNRTMTRNLRMCFPDWTDKQVKKVAKGTWETLGRTVGEMPHLKRIQPYVPGTRIEVVGLEHVEAVKASGKPAVFIGLHMANWELISATICRKFPDAHITYRAVNNPHIDKRIVMTRLSAGITSLTPKGAGTRDLMRALANKQCIGLMNDQKFNQGVSVPFFGHEAMTAPGATRMARRYGVPLFPIAVKRIGIARYRVTFHEPFMPDDSADETTAIYNTVLRINQWAESCIRDAPDQWFWMHHRWPKEAWRKAGVV